MPSRPSHQGTAGNKDPARYARLQILATTDLHMQLLAYDYFSRSDVNITGLISLTSQIESLRSKPGTTTLLFDNGDFLQGNPLGDYLATLPPDSATHPMIAAFNTLGYDAITLGNHEFNYGLPYLRATLKNAQCAVTCANIRHLKGPELAKPYVILDRVVFCDDGSEQPLRVGVIGFVPPQITKWDNDILKGEIETDDIVRAAQTLVPQIKAEGADIIVALCHSGIGSAFHHDGMENAAVPLAAVPGIDVIVTGHTHEIFPSDSKAPNPAVDPKAGTLHGKPAVMAGFYASHLGVIALDLDITPGGVRVARHSARLAAADRSIASQNDLHRKLVTLVQPAHDATLAQILQPIARTEHPLHSYFCAVVPDLPQQLLAGAQTRAIRDALACTAYRDLPILSATASFRYGGRAGPGQFIDIPPGPMTMRDAAAIYPFANALCAVRRTGGQLRDWLEWALMHFQQIQPGQHDQALINPQVPGYNFDTIFGLTYEINLSEPARFGPDGRIANPQASRLKNLCYKGLPVADDDVFIVAANSYRSQGGGGFSGIHSDDIIYRGLSTARDTLIADLRARQFIHEDPVSVWQFSAIANTSAVFQSAPKAQHHITPNVTHLGPHENGFDLFRFTF